MSKPGIGEREIGWPSHKGWNRFRCRKCGHLSHGGSPCACPEPDMECLDSGRMRTYQAWCERWAAECLRVLKPGGHILAFGGTRTFHRLACAIEDIGFEIRDEIACLLWAYGTGFPKSLNLDGPWEGWGTSLKPAHEPVVVARKPLAGTVAENVAAHGVGAIHVDACRLHTAGSEAKDYRVVRLKPGATLNATGGNWRPEEGGVEYAGQTKAGRWPPNLLLVHHPDCREVGTKRVKGHKGYPNGPGGSSCEFSQKGTPTTRDQAWEGYAAADGLETVAAWECVEGCAVRMLDEQTGILRARGNRTAKIHGPMKDSAVNFLKNGLSIECGWPGDSGGASRFYPTFAFDPNDLFPVLYCPKADRAERGPGNRHPTVKPVALCRWLCRLVTPPDGLILDPFIGSGTVAVAALKEGFRFLGIDQSAEYLEVARRRISEAKLPLFDGL